MEFYGFLWDMLERFRRISLGLSTVVYSFVDTT